MGRSRSGGGALSLSKGGARRTVAAGLVGAQGERPGGAALRERLGAPRESSGREFLRTSSLSLMTSAALAADSTRRNVRPRIMFWHAQQHAAKIRAAVKAGGKSGMVPLSLNLGGAAWARQRWPPAPSAPGRRRRAAAAARLSVIAAKAASAGTGPSTGGSARRRRRRGTVPPRPLDAQDTIQLPLAARQLAVAAAEEHDLLRVLLRAHERGPQVRLGLDARKGEDAERRADDQGRDRRVQGGDGEHGDEALGHEPVEHRQERAALDHVHDELDAQAQDLGFFCAWGFPPPADAASIAPIR